MQETSSHGTGDRSQASAERAGGEIARAAGHRWWKSVYVWLIIGFSVVTFVAGTFTVYLSMQLPAQSPGSPLAVGQTGALEPALQARNRTSIHNAQGMGKKEPVPPDAAAR